MQALILAGGQGTRLRPLTLNIPKPIVPIGNQPFLLRQIRSLKNAGVRDIILSAGYQPSAIKEALGDGSRYGVRLRYVIEPFPMGTAGAYKFAEKFISATTLVLNGDILTDIDLKKVSDQHKERKSTATIVLTPVENPSAYGLVETDAEGNVLRFLEKPKPEELEKINTNNINAGIYILEPEVLDRIPSGENFSFEYQLFPRLLAAAEKFRAFEAKGNYWLDIGTPQRYLQAHFDLLGGKIKNIDLSKNNNFEQAPNAVVDTLSCIAEGCVIRGRSKISNSFLGKNVLVEEDAVVENCVIWSGTKINAGTRIFDSILGSECLIGRHVQVCSGTVLGDKSTVPDFTSYI